jgi:hypothetical protein
MLTINKKNRKFIGRDILNNMGISKITAIHSTIITINAK